jgi:hypothetical protein
MQALRLAVPAALLLALPVSAADPLAGVIDRHVDAKLAEDDLTAAPPADDATLVRRLTLDLVGRIPTAGEVRAFADSAAADKRERLADRLIASPAFARYQGYLFDLMLSDRPGRSNGLREYLTVAVRENRPWDRVFRELLLPDDDAPGQKGASEFLRGRLMDADKLTNDVSVAFFGVNVSCAQCHDHPLVKDWTQEHFFGLKSFLARTYDAGGRVGERAAGLVRYKPNKGAERAARMMFLTGATVEHPTVRESTVEELKREKRNKGDTAPPPVPAFSARAKLVDLALADGRFFARAIVNRLWHRFLGTGLVSPLDQMHSENEPSHPELLDALADDLRAHGYDLRRLVRGIVLSRAYARDSVYGTAAQPPADRFAVARLRPLTPAQLATSLKIAGTDPKAFDGLKPDEFERRIEQLEASARGFAGLLPVPTADGVSIGVGEALLFSNGDRLAKEFLADGGGTLLARAKGTPDDAAAVTLLVTAALGRPPADDERAALAGYVAARPDRRPEALRQVLWAVVTGPEFRFNH